MRYCLIVSKVLIGFLLTLLLVGCGSLPLLQAQPSPVTLKVVVLPHLSYGPYYIAEAEGFFAEQGLTVEYIRFQRSQEAIPALVQGQVDVLGGAISAGFLNTINRGANIRMVADKGRYYTSGCSANGILIRRALAEKGELKDAAQLKGKRVVVNTASTNNFVIEQLLATAGLTHKDVQFMDVPDNALADAFDKDQIDMVVVLEPVMSRLIQGGHAVVWRTADEVAPGLTYGFVSYGPNLLEKTPMVGQRFMNAYLKGVRQYLQGKTERNLAIMQKATELDLDTLKQACWPDFSPDGSVELTQTHRFQTWSKTRGFLDEVVPSDKLWDGRFIDAAKRAQK